MTKWVISTLESIKKEYVIDAYTEKEAKEKMYTQAPSGVDVLGEQIYTIECINEYEHDKFYKESQMTINWP